MKGMIKSSHLTSDHILNAKVSFKSLDSLIMLSFATFSLLLKKPNSLNYIYLFFRYVSKAPSFRHLNKFKA